MVLFSAHPLESCLNDPLILECKAGLCLLDLRAGGLALIRLFHKGGHLWVNFWDILRYKPRFFCSLLPAASLGKNLVTLSLQPAGWPSPPELGDPAVVEGSDVGEEEVPKPPDCLKVVL